MVTFAEPAQLWLLAAPAGAAVLAVLRHQRRLGQQRSLASPAVWLRLMGGAPATGIMRMLLWCLAAVALALALARPQWGELPAEESVHTRELLIALDVSDSMLCPDVQPSRLRRALEELQRVLPRLAGNRIGIVVFAGAAYPLIPLTTDLNAVATFLDGVEAGMVGLPGSNLEQAVTTATRLLPDQGEGRVVVLISDGENLQGSLEAAAAALTEKGASVLAVITGTAAGGPIPVLDDSGKVHYKIGDNGQPVVTRAQREVLAGLAESMNGEVLELVGHDLAEQLVATIERLRTRALQVNREIRRVERFPLLLGAAAGLLALGFLASPWRRMAALVLVATLLGWPQAIAQQAAPPEATAEEGGRRSAATPSRPGAVEEGRRGGNGSLPAVQPVLAPVQPVPPWLQPDQQPRPGSPPAANAEPPVPEPPQLSWWQRLIPGAERRLARAGADHWQRGELEAATRDFMAALELDASPDRQYDLGTVLAARGSLQAAVPLMNEAHQHGVSAAAYNLGTAALEQKKAGLAVAWLREALLSAPDDPEVKYNYELALRLLEQMEQQQDDQDQDEENQNQQPEPSQPQPTPTPAPAGQAPVATPTPSTESAIYAALERAEAAAREQMQRPTPQAAKVEKDW
jgi:Ca-activated chloride channel family protein